MRIVDRGTVYRNESEPARQSCAFPGVCVLPSGRWLCGFAAAPLKSHNQRECLLAYSDDAGRSWTTPYAPFGAEQVAGRPGSFRAVYPAALDDNRVLAALIWVDQSDPSLPFFNETTEGLLDTRIFLATSEDGGKTWSRPQLMDTAPLAMPTPLTGPVLVNNGEWICQCELNKPYYDTTPWRHNSILMFSRDEGRTWPQFTAVTNNPRIFFWDQRPAFVGKSRLLDVFWTFDRDCAKYLNIHASASSDGGHTWSAMWDTGIPGQPAAPVLLPDGQVALVYVDRTGPPVIKVRTSADGGRSWPAETELILYETGLKSQTWNKQSMQDAWAEMGKFSVGLPATAATQTGELIVVYYAGTHTDHTGIEWVRVGC